MVPFFNHAYKKIRETGSWLRMKERWADAGNTGQCDQVTDYHPISIYKIISLLILLLLGIGTSVSILVFENITAIIIGSFKHHRSSISVGSIRSMEPINSNKKGLCPINFDKKVLTSIKFLKNVKRRRSLF